MGTKLPPIISSVDSLAKSRCSLILLYMNRNLTRDRDRLAAISALAMQHSCSELGTYLAGSWYNYLLGIISWFKATNSRGLSVHRRPSSYIAPSWSWTSLVGAINRSFSGFLLPTELPKFVAEIKEAECEFSYGDRFGPVKSGQLVISSPYMVAKIQTKAGEKPTLDHEAFSNYILDVDTIDGQ